MAEELHTCGSNPGIMKKTRLKFSSAIYLIAFRRYSKAGFWEIDLTNLTVRCDCSSAEARTACAEFGAVVLLQEEVEEPLLMEEKINLTPGQHRFAS